MSSVCERLGLRAGLILASAVALPFAGTTEAGPAAEAKQLRVCADPNNLPFSNERGEGFENALAELIAGELGLETAYVWWPQRRGFIRNTLKTGRCDVVMGVPAGYELVASTKPYYRSSYVFVMRADSQPAIGSFDDPRLQHLRIGVHVVGDDYSNPPPVEALARRGIVANVHGYSIYGDYSQPDPPRDLIDALAAGEIDVAIAWGPLGGYFAEREPVDMTVTPVQNPMRAGLYPMAFDISMGVRRGDDALKARLERVLDERRDDIHALLASYGVPLLASSAALPQDDDDDADDGPRE